MIHYLAWNEVPPVTCRNGALAIGNFDGVHLGHVALVAELCKQANRVGGPAVILTFDPHPLKLLRPEQFQPVLTTAAERDMLLKAKGADHVIVIRTTSELLNLSAEEFFEHVIRNGVQPRVLVEGFNFGFGRDRLGTVEVLSALCKQVGMGFVVVPPWQLDGKPVSSSRVRAALVHGDVREASRLLGRPLRIWGRVGEGQKRGQMIGFPTANLEQIETLTPGDGVYAARVTCKGKIWPAAVNIGPNPTFGEQTRKVEVHLIGFKGNLYGKELPVEFVERLRDTRPFPSVNELVEQLKVDMQRARELTETSREMPKASTC